VSQQLPNVGKYKCKRLIGQGNFGAVYEAIDRALQCPRAIKLIQSRDPNKLIEELKEARLLEICKHKHVVEVKDADIYTVNSKKIVVISTELLQSGSAQDLLLSGFVSLQKSIQILCDSLFGLEHLHNNGVLHCDIKPGNILLTKMGRAKLSDFGLAISLKQGQSPLCVYTLHMAPENNKGLQGSILADIYAAGVTFYRLINNIVDFRALTPQNAHKLIAEGKFPNRKDYSVYVPSKIKRITNKSMHVDPTKRYQSAAAFRQALEKIRIAINWKRISSSEWKGEQGQHTFQILAEPRKTGWMVEFKQNHRRKNKFCRSGFKNNWLAESYISKLVSETSIA
jgi:serine/threonine protein kinase